MKKADLLLILFAAVLFLPFVFIPELYAWYNSFNAEHGFIMAFFKFAILATAGEMIGLRIKTGNYTAPYFGMMPRAILWGFFGMWTALAMKVFAAGVPPAVAYIGGDSFIGVMAEVFTWQKLVTAFCISVMMNTTYGPVFMTLHKITDAHIYKNKGKLSALTIPINMVESFQQLDWNVQWNFVFKKTVPFFWFPAHTITFLLPTYMQVLFAALLSIALGVILSIAAVKGRK
jgi:hypothetical protein